MTLYEFTNIEKKPVIGKGTYIFRSADIIGDVTVGKNCYIGPGARLRGDYGTIKIGDNTAIEDNAVIHARPSEITVIGKYVTIGHGSIIHNATINDWAIIGMGAVVSDWAEIGKWAVVAEGAVVKNKQKIPDYAIAVGLPAKVVGKVSDEYRKQWSEFKNTYRMLAVKKYPVFLKEIGV
jgi:carbonic anhydrase/acetyltransferase-like protein (isoleucine patch superfamily)